MLGLLLNSNGKQLKSSKQGSDNVRFELKSNDGPGIRLQQQREKQSRDKSH